MVGKLTPGLEEEAQRLAALSDADIDLSDMPEVVPSRWAVRGLFANTPKQTVTVSLDVDLIEYLRINDWCGLDARLNSILREWVARIKHASDKHGPEGT